MSTGILYHCFGITGRGIHHVHTRFEAGKTIFRIGQDPTTFACSSCGSRKVMKKGTVFRRFVTLPIGLRPTIIEFPIQRVLCLACGMIRQVKIEFAEPDRRYTKRFERYVLELSKHMTMTDVAHHLGISWHTVKEIQKRYLQRRFSCPSLFGLQRIAVDEISVGHGHRYLTVVLDLDSGAVVFVGEGKGADALEPFWRTTQKVQSTNPGCCHGHVPGIHLCSDHPSARLDHRVRSFPRDQALQRKTDRVASRSVSRSYRSAPQGRSSKELDGCF